MEEIKAPKKERKFLKAMGDVALTLLRDLLLNVGKKLINKVGNKRQGLAIALVMVAGISYAAIDSIPYPITGNKQKLGWQTTGNGLVYRGTAADTVTKPSNYTNKDIKAYLLVDTVNNVMYSYIASKGGWKFNNSDTVIVNNTTDTTSLSNRINLKLNISDTASMLTNYLRTNVASSTYQPILVSGTNIKTVNSNSLLGSGNISVGTITGSGSNLYFPIFTSSTNITQSLLRWDGTATPNSILYNDYNSNQLIGALTVGGTLGVTGAITGGGGITVTGISRFGNIGVGGDSMIVNGFLKLNNRYSTTTDVNRIVAFNTDNSVLSELNFSNLFDVENSGVGSATQTLNIKSASTTQIGVVDISSQSFFGNKTFTSNITLENDVDNRQGYLRRGYVTITNATYTVADNVSWIICNRAGGTITITLPNALDNDGRELHIKNITTNSVISNATNVVELADNAATTAILSASKDGGWATLVSNGSNWVIMQAN